MFCGYEGIDSFVDVLRIVVVDQYSVNKRLALVISELLALSCCEGNTALGVILVPDPDELGAVLGHNIKLQCIPIHLIEQRLDMLQHGVRQIFSVENLLQIKSRDIRHDSIVELITVFKCSQCAILGTALLAGQLHNGPCTVPAIFPRACCQCHFIISFHLPGRTAIFYVYNSEWL